jgi:hypothetical protein
MVVASAIVHALNILATTRIREARGKPAGCSPIRRPQIDGQWLID